MKKAFIAFMSIVFSLILVPYISKAQCTPTFQYSGSLCSNQTVYFDDSTNMRLIGSDTVISEIWSYGDGKLDTLNGASARNFQKQHQYTSDGSYTVSLYIHTVKGCYNSLSKSITIHPNPKASFSSSDSIFCTTPYNVQFTNNTVSNDGVNYLWYFSDKRDTSTKANPSYLFNGSSYATLYATSNFGCVDSIKSYFTASPLIAGYTYYADTIGSKKIHFTDTTINTNNSITHWSWNFGDGDTSNLQNPVHTYANYGTYPVSLIVTASKGCQDTITKNINFGFAGKPCFSSFYIYNGRGCSNTLTRFKDSAMVNITDTVAKEIWNFGDGNIDTLVSGFAPSQYHNYLSSGIYNVSLTVYTQTGCSSTTTNSFSVIPSPPVADSFSYIQLSPACSAPYNVQFSANVPDGNLTTVAAKWDFGDGSPVTVSDTTLHPFHIYNAAGDYNVTLMIRLTGCSLNKDTAIKKITLYAGPKAGLKFSQQNDTSKTMNFTDLSNPVLGNISNWYWDFGDGDTALIANPSHTYKTLGVYSVKHYIKSTTGCFSDTAITYCYVDSVKSSGSTLYQSNMGTDFWAGFGYEERMKSGGAAMSIYIATGNEAASVVVSLPDVLGSTGFPRLINLPANSFYEVTNFPTGDPTDSHNASGMPDTRLYYTGILKRGIHITSSAPIAAWEHVYASNNSAGATLLMPINVWGNDYTVQTMGGVTNSGIPNSYFFVIAKDDSTIITFTPTNNIIDSSASSIFNAYPTNILYKAGTTYSIILNKGQIFNAMGSVDGTSPGGVDLSGTRIFSPDPTKKIAVFGGNGRLIINTNSCANTKGSDNLIQQMFPRVAWGTEYLTIPTKTMEYGIYRVTVYDTTTVVKVNGNILPTTSLINSSYYQFENNIQNKIEASKNIMATQFIVSPNCPDSTMGNAGAGDPEMIILSPVVNKINNTIVYAAPFKNALSGASYINVIINKGDTGNFKIDGSNMVDTGTSSYTSVGLYGSSALIPASSAFKVHSGDSSYCYGRFKVSYPAAHILSSDSGFTAIAYGLNSGESWGYNAGFRLNYPHVQYTFTGNGNWSDPANWLNGLMPPGSTLSTGSEVIISGNCLLDIPETIQNGATLTVLTGGHLTVNGNLTIQN